MTMTGYLTGGKQTAVEAMAWHRQCVEQEERATRRFMESSKIKPPLYDATKEELGMARSYYGVRLRPLDLNSIDVSKWSQMTRALYRNAEAAGFTVDSRPPPIRVYDRVHSTDPSWAEKVKKDDYKNLVLYKNNARMDEDNREIPILANSEYGHRLRALPEKFKRANVRIAIYNASTYRKNGIPFQKDQRPAV